MASGTVKVHRVVFARGIVFRTNWIVRAELCLVERREEVIADVPTGFDQAAKRPLRA